MSFARTRFKVALPALLCLALLVSGCQPIAPEAAAEVPTAPTAPTAPTSSAVAAEAEPAPAAPEPLPGKISVAGVELDFVINVTSANEDDFTATMDIPQQGAFGLPVHSIVVDGPNVTFAILEGPQQATFTGTFVDDRAIEGTFVQAGQEGTFTLDWSGEAQAAAESTATAAPAEETASGIASTYADPAGFFTAPVPTNWTAEEREGFVTLRDPEGEIAVHLLTVSTDDLEAAIATAWELVQPGFDVAVDQQIEVPPMAGNEKGLFINYGSDTDDQVIQAYADLFEGVSYVLLAEGDLNAVQRRSAQLGIIQSGFDILAREEVDLSNVAPAPLSDEIVAQWEQFISDTMPLFDIPGAVVGVVQGGELVYARGFGYADDAQQTPMTAQTHMLIGSTSKSFTTMMMATLVDDGLMEWDTPARELYPSFAVKDPALSETITMRNLVCACTGVPRRDFELLYNASELNAEDVVASLRDFEFFTDFGEAFQYSNQMVATGGYIAGHAAQPGAAALEEAYATALQERVLDPIGMGHTTLSFDEVEQAGDYATPHGYTARGEYAPITLATERTLTPIVPAGGLWSTLEDMAKYMVTQLNSGVAPDGTRVVSEENLLVTRVPQVKITADASYGLGWMISNYKGLPLIDHGGNTLGFTSDFAFFPTADLGIIVLTNAQGTTNFSASVRTRLVEMLYGVESEVEPSIDFVVQQLEQQRQELAQQIGTLDPAAVEPFLGSYTSQALGGLRLTLEDGKLYSDMGEFRSELLPKLNDAGEPDGYITADAPLAGLPMRLEMNDAGQPSAVLGAGIAEYTFLPE